MSRRPAPIWVHDLAGNRRGALGRDLLDWQLERRGTADLDTVDILRFEIPATSSKRYLIVPDAELEYLGDRFRIVEVEDERRGPRVVTRVEAEATWYELAADAQPGTVVVANETPAAGLATILAGAAAWSVGTSSTSASATYSLEEDDRTTLELLRTWSKITGRALRFDTVNRLVDIVDTRGRDLGLAFRYGRNVAAMRRRARAPEVTRLYAYGKNELSIAGQTGTGVEYVEDLTYYTARGLSAGQAAERFTRAAIWSDTSFVDDEELYAAALDRLAQLSAEVTSYELDAADLSELVAGQPDYATGDTVRVYDPDIAVDDAGNPVDLRGVIVRTVKHPKQPWRDAVEVSFRPPQLRDRSSSSSRAGTSDAWYLFTGPIGTDYQIRGGGVYTVARIPLRFSSNGAAHLHLDLRLTGVGAGIVTVQLFDAVSGEQVHTSRVRSYTDAETLDVPLTVAMTELEGRVDWRIRVDTASSPVTSSASGVDATADADGSASFYVLAQNAVRESPTAANTERFDYTGTVQTFTVPDNVTEVTATVAGAGGGSDAGGDGGLVKMRLPVTPGAIIDVNVGGSPADDQPGWPNGGAGGDMGGGAANDGFGGGGSTDIRPSGGAFADAYIVAAGGGGGAHDGYAGGFGGFYKGGDATTHGSAIAATGATQTAGGLGEQFSNGNGNDGTFGQGGDARDSSSSFRQGGGGGGGGWYGGGGGCLPDAILDGAGGGSGGSGYILPALFGLGAIEEIDDGANPGDGYVVFEWETPQV